MKIAKTYRTIISATAIIVIVLLMIVAGIWANKQASNAVCRNMVIELENADSSTFVTKQLLERELARLDIHPLDKPFSRINTRQIEEKLRQLDYLEDVECIVPGNNTLVIRAKQLVPVMHIFNGNTSYYVNHQGKRMAASARYHADVPVVSGRFNDDFPPTRLLPLIRYVENDQFLNSLITMYSVRDSNNVFIVPCIRGHVVNIGDVSNLNAKFAKLRQFYDLVVSQKGWLYYDTISVKFQHQVVATRRVKSIKASIDWSQVPDELDADLETMTTGDTLQQHVNAPAPKATTATPKASSTSAPSPAKTQDKTSPSANSAPAASKVKNAFKKNN